MSRHMIVGADGLQKNPSDVNLTEGSASINRSHLRRPIIAPALPQITINRQNDSPPAYLRKPMLQGKYSSISDTMMSNSRGSLPQNPANRKLGMPQNVIDLNSSTRIPRDVSHRKNKNDFFRFLLAQNYQAQSGPEPEDKSIQGNYRMNNDVLIPRSILKRALAGGVKEKRAQIAAEDSFRNHIMEIIHADMQSHPQPPPPLGIEDHTEDDEFLHKDEAILGKRLHKDHMLLSPKLRDLIQSFD